MKIPTLNIIHLVERTDRKNILLKQLLGYKIPFKIWHGFVVEKLPFKGISRSHKQIVSFAKNSNMPFVIIGEDDINFTSPKSWQHYIDNMPPDSETWDIYFGTISGGVVDEEKKEISGTWSGLILYTVHERFYETFLLADEEKNLDRYFSGIGAEDTKRRLGREPVYKICYPIVATCVDGFSDNSKKEVDHEQYFRPYKKFQ